jgi:hypothetical protein
VTSRNQDRAQWYRIDLHTHTPASADYHQPEISYIDILQRAEMRGIDIIAFTDHNTVSGYAAMRREIEQLQFLVARGRATPDEQRTLEEYHRLLENILVLPGFEFTATFGFHILGIFPPDTPMRKLEHVLLDLRVPYEAIERGLTEVGASSDVLAAYRAIREAGGIAIAAHVNAAHGVAMWNMDFGGQTRIAYTQDVNLHALEVTDLSKRGRFATQNFFNGNKPEYPRPMRCIQGSDAHRLDSQTDRLGKIINFGVGERPTEARLRDRSFAALKAMLEDDDFSSTRAYTPALQPKDPLLAAFAEGATQTQALHESPTQGGVLRLNILSDICAFANSQGGTLYLGVSETRRVPVGVENPTQIIEQIIRATSLMLIPPINLVMGTVEANGKTIVRVQVPRGGERPYALEGSRIYLRNGHETRLATRDEIIALVMDSRTRGSTPASTPAAIAAAEPEAPRAPRDERRSDGRPRREERREREGRRPLPPMLDIRETAAPAPTAEEPAAYPVPERDERPPRPERPERPLREERSPRPERPTREGRSAFAPQAPQQAVASVSDADLPRVGVELIAVEPRGSLNIYTLRDLQTKAIVKNITRVTKAKAWQYVIKQNETNPVQLERVRWNGACGLWRKYRRLTEVRYDLVLRTADGARYFYGIPESELRGGWAVFAQMEAQSEDGAGIEMPGSQEPQDVIETPGFEARQAEVADVPVPEAVEVPMPIVQIAQEAHGVEDATEVVAESDGDEAAAGETVMTDAPAKRKRRRRGGRRRNKGGAAAAAEAIIEPPSPQEREEVVETPSPQEHQVQSQPQRREGRTDNQSQRRGGRSGKEQAEQAVQTQPEAAPIVEMVAPAAVVPDAPAVSEAQPAQVRNRRGAAGTRKRHAPSLLETAAPAEPAIQTPAQQAADATVKARKRGRNASAEPVAHPPAPELAPEAPTADASKPKRRSGTRKKGEG